MRVATALALFIANASPCWGLIVPTGPATIQGNGIGPQICAGASGAYVVTWWDASSGEEVLAQRFDAAGQALGAQIDVGPGREPRIACGAGGDFVVVFVGYAAERHYFTEGVG